MKPDLFKKRKQDSLNSRIGRYFILPDWKGYGENDSAKVKNVFSADKSRKPLEKSIVQQKIT